MKDKTLLLKLQHPVTKTNMTLKVMIEEHLQHIVQLAQDPALISIMGWNTFFEVTETKAFIEAIAEHTFPYSCPSPPIVFGIYLDTEPLPKCLMVARKIYYY